MRLLLLKDNRTEVDYGEFIGHKLKPKRGDVFIRSLMLYDEQEHFRMQKVRLKVKVVTVSSAHVEVF